jgi:hypothetical protein
MKFFPFFLHGMTFLTADQGIIWRRVFLILSCNDKPAQALIQNVGEPHGRFGCGSCTIEGWLCNQKYKTFQGFKKPRQIALK